MATVHTRVERARGCGFRKPGGLYLVGPPSSSPCGKLPIPLERCPTCDQGIKPSRGWQWVSWAPLVASRTCHAGAECATCPASFEVAQAIGRVGLLWIGEKFYGTPAEFMREALEMGVSRRIKAIPREFEIGRSWVALAHRMGKCEGCSGTGTYHKLEDENGPDLSVKCEACDGQGTVKRPAIFSFFQPQAIEYVVKGTESEEELDQFEKRGLTLVNVQHAGEQEPIPA